MMISMRKHEILNILDVHEPVRVWVAVATPPAREEVQVWSEDYPPLWFVAPRNSIVGFRLSSKLVVSGSIWCFFVDFVVIWTCSYPKGFIRGGGLRHV